MIVKFAKTHEDAREPTRGSAGAAGFDLYAVEDVVIAAGERAILNTGIVFEIPEGHYGRVAPRSGLAAKFGIDVLAGICDFDYRGSVCVILLNTGKEEFHVKKGDRVAQFIFEKITIAEELEEVSHEDLTQTERGANGFGSTGR
jgi:dUTP pyrophosphatase